jgi:hypothetical protein
VRLTRDPVFAAAREFAKARGERATAVATARDGRMLVTTDRAFYVGEDLRWPWDRVVRAGWDADETVLSVLGSPSPEVPAQTVEIPMEESLRLLDTLRSEVTSNLVASRRIEDPVHGGAWVTARHVTGSDEIRWTVVFDAGRDPRDPARRAWADDQVAEIRGSTGI